MERGGIITSKGIQEVQNQAPDPENGFEFGFEDLHRLDDPKTLATFHTHPNASSNLTNLDYVAFMSYPKLKHYIVGNDGVRCYRVHKGQIIEEN